MGEAPFPAKAEFSCGRYSDGSGYEITIGYDTTQPRWETCIIIDGFAVSFDHRHTEEVMAALQFCADAIRSRLPVDAKAPDEGEPA